MTAKCTCDPEWSDHGAHFANCPWLKWELARQEKEAQEGMDEFIGEQLLKLKK